MVAPCSARPGSAAPPGSRAACIQSARPLHNQLAAAWGWDAAQLWRVAGDGAQRRLLSHTCRAEVQQPLRAPDDVRATKVRAEVTRRIVELGRTGKAREAVSQLASMARLGVQPDTQAATALIYACTRNGNMEMAQAAFEELFGDLLTPDDVTFSVLVRGYGECEPVQWTAISGLLSLMERKYSQPPSITIYNSLLEICARTRDMTRGEEVVGRMARAGVLPDEDTLEVIRNRKAMRTLLKRTFGAEA